MNIKYLKKRFSVGLALDSGTAEYETLFRDYGEYIDNLYFSPPLGQQFHGRTKIAEQLKQPMYIERFWEILRLAQDFQIGLEVVYNTHMLQDNDFIRAEEMFSKNLIKLSKICVQDAYYDFIRSLYPTMELVHSVNSMPDEKDKILQAAGAYSEYVVGRQYTRDTELFHNIAQTGSRCVLLLNNGCSHFCNGCSTPEHCQQVFEKTRSERHMTEEQIYALQSIMPFELHEGCIDLTDISLLKLSTRNADVTYIRFCLDSYINGIDRELLDKSSDYYLLWARLLWLTKYFKSFDYERIYAYKKSGVMI